MTLTGIESRSRTTGIWNRVIGAASLAAIAVGLAGCNLKPRDVCVYVDNAGNEPLVITVDDQPAVKAPPGDVAKVELPPGEHRFLIKCGDEVLCDLVRKLEPSDRFGVTRKYLFNPDKLTRYQAYEAKYGENRFAGVMQASLLAYQKDPVIKRKYVYQQLLKEVKLVPSDAWNDVTGTDYVLTPPPQSVRTKGTARRTVISRVKPRLYEMMQRMAKIEQPSEEDVDSLDELLDEMFAEAL